MVRRLKADASRLALGTDPDQLLLEERTLHRIEALGFDLITSDDLYKYDGVDAPSRRHRDVPRWC